VTRSTPPASVASCVTHVLVDVEPFVSNRHGSTRGWNSTRVGQREGPNVALSARTRMRYR